MCPICKTHDDKPCPILERKDGHLVCGCGKHSWPDTGALQETCRQVSLTTVRTVHNWTQGF